MKASRLSSCLRRAWLLGAALVMTVGARAVGSSFSDGLSPSERSAAGTSKLTASQVAVLDGLVAQDVTLAHDGGVTGFSSGFSARHWDRERLATGLDRLSAEERAALDTYAARAIALGPPPGQEFTYSPPRAAPAPPPPPPPAAVMTAQHFEVHGDVSFTVGAGSHGSNFYGTAADLSVTDPTGHFTVAFGVEDYRGKGLLGLCAPDGPLGPGYFADPYLGW